MPISLIFIFVPYLLLVSFIYLIDNHFIYYSELNSAALKSFVFVSLSKRFISCLLKNKHDFLFYHIRIEIINSFNYCTRLHNITSSRIFLPIYLDTTVSYTYMVSLFNLFTFNNLETILMFCAIQKERIHNELFWKSNLCLTHSTCWYNFIHMKKFINNPSLIIFF